MNSTEAKVGTRNMNASRFSSFTTRLASTTALVSMALVYGARTPVRAGVCTGSGGVYNCSGAANPITDVEQNLNPSPDAPVTATTAAGFGIDTTNQGGFADGITISSNGGSSFTDNYASSITGYYHGISARNFDSGDNVITVTGNVTSAGNGAGIFGFAAAGTGNLEINAATVTGEDEGIRARSLGNGTISVSASGHVTGGASGANFVGIDAYNTGSGIYVDAASVSGGRSGISANQNGGTGNVEITATGLLTGTSQRGAIALNSGTGNVSISVVSATGGFEGVSGRNTNGSLTITSTGTLTGNSRDGVIAISQSSATTQLLNINNAYGDEAGISTNHSGSGTSTINVSGIVTGNNVAGIETISATGVDTVINLNSGADVSATSGVAISNDDGNATINANAGSTLSGSVLLGGGTDNVIIDGADWSGLSVLDGGAGTDSVTLRNLTANIADTDIINVEDIIVDSGGNVSLDGSFNSNVSVENGGQLSAGASPGQTNILGDLDLGTGATTLVELAGLLAGTQYDQIDVTDDSGTGAVEGNANISNGAIFDIDFFGGFTAGLGDNFEILIADTINSGTVSNFVFDFSDAILGTGLAWEASFFDAGGRDGLQLTVVADEGPPSELPEPSSLVLFGAGVLGIAGMARRRRKAA